MSSASESCFRLGRRVHRTFLHARLAVALGETTEKPALRPEHTFHNYENDAIPLVSVRQNH